MAFVIIFYQGTGGLFLGLWARESGGEGEERWVEVRGEGGGVERRQTREWVREGDKTQRKLQ